MTDPKTWKRAAGAAGLVATDLVAGGILAGTLSANAADTGTTPSAGTSSSETVDPSQPQRSDEQLLTGDTTTGVVKAVVAKFPDAMMDPPESVSAGVYESNIVTAAGQQVIVQVGEDFTVPGTQTGGGGGPGGHHGPDGDADDSGTGTGTGTGDD